MSSRNRQLLVLLALIVAFVWLIGRQLMPALSGSGAVLSRSPATAGSSAGERPAEIAELRLEALEHKPATYRPGRDPFRFGPRPKKQPRAPKPAPVVAPVAPPPRQVEQPARPPQPPRPQPPAVEFVYLGSFGLPGREIAVFSDGKEILNAFAGGVLREEFVVRSIGYESADIGFVNFPEAPAKRLAVGG